MDTNHLSLNLSHMRTLYRASASLIQLIMDLKSSFSFIVFPKEQPVCMLFQFLCISLTWGVIFIIFEIVIVLHTYTLYTNMPHTHEQSMEERCILWPDKRMGLFLNTGTFTSLFNLSLPWFFIYKTHKLSLNFLQWMSNK